MAKIAFYGGSFDPLHSGHLAVARSLLDLFRIDRFYFVPAFHAPHKTRTKPTSPFDRYAMICAATERDDSILVSKIEIEMPERPYSVETLTRLNEMYPDDEIYFVMGADSWMDITTWREWHRVLSLTNHIVVTRPGYQLSFDHVGDEVRRRIVDVRGSIESIPTSLEQQRTIFITDAVNVEISATSVRSRIRGGDGSWRRDVTIEVANYIEKYQIYK